MHTQKHTPTHRGHLATVQIAALEERVGNCLNLICMGLFLMWQEGEQGSVVAPQQKQQQQVPDKKEKKKHFQKLRAAVQRLLKLKSES